MDDDGGLNMRNWGFFEQPSLKGSLGLQLMPNVASDGDTKPLLSNGGFLHRDCGEPSIHMDFVRDSWFHQNRDNSKVLHMHPLSIQGYGALPDTSGGHTVQMMQPPLNPLKEEKLPQIDEPYCHNDAPLKKRSQGHAIKTPKPKKPKKVNNQAREGSSNGSVSKVKATRKSTGLVINGIDLDLSGIPTPVCTCTGTPQQCYRWGVGGWQSACCTTTISRHPLPISTKRRGARIAGRKMSQGAFKKVLEKLVGEGHNLANPIDLKTFWAKHGTNKFVTIR